MTPASRKLTACRPAAQVALIVLFFGPVATASAQEASAAELVRFLSYGSGRPGRQNIELGISSCGQYGADREAAASLVALGARAVPEIERALDSIERLGGASEFALGSQWLVDAYAQIKGREAYSRLARFGTELGVDLGDAVALSLGLTSVVSASRRLGTTIHCDGPGDARDAMDLFILAWERGDQTWLERTLGPAGRASLSSLLHARTWADLRSEVWRREPVGLVAVGYRFDNSTRWSGPRALLRSPEPRWDADSDPTRIELVTFFTDRSGRECGKQTIPFETVSGGRERELPYLVDSRDVDGLLRLISSCAAGK